ncbi:putative membrane protein, partial [Acinetobacter baumannii 1288284]
YRKTLTKKKLAYFYEFFSKYAIVFLATLVLFLH